MFTHKFGSSFVWVTIVGAPNATYLCGSIGNNTEIYRVDVKDATGAVLPGVTVEASSPALIERVRTVVTDGEGQFKIVDLRPGAYTVTFTLVGFSTMKRDGIDLDECERVVGELSMRMPGVARYFTRAQLENSFIASADPIVRRVLHGFYPQRSGDVIVVFEPYNILFDLPDDPTDPHSTATHGSPYSYDTHVPLIMMGRDFAKGSYDQAATPADIAPTLAGLLRVQPPSCSTGRVLSEALVKPGERRRPPVR